ncbi:MAG TPA: phosphatase PAP2 family protein [Candidatus Saccharimonadales bacterium]|nr:phosphatase PAP2 family protein [Candidatus Saccharimonadales bacterium]
MHPHTHLPVPATDFSGTRAPVVTVRQSVLRLLLLGAAAAVLCGLVYVVAVLTPAGQFVADLILYGRPAGDSRAETFASDALGTISLTMVAGVTLGLAGIAFLTGRPHVALAVLVTIVGANVTTEVLKLVVLDRPDLLGHAAYSAANSFPSGHVTIAASLVLAALLVVPPALRALAAVAGALYVAVVGMSAVAAGWHRLDDAIGAILVALAWAALGTAVLAAGWSALPRRSWSFGSARSGTSLLAFASAVALLLGAAVLLYAWLNPEFAARSPAAIDDAPRVFVGALAVIAGAALGACASLLWAMRGIVLEPRS